MSYEQDEGDESTAIGMKGDDAVAKVSESLLELIKEDGTYSRDKEKWWKFLFLANRVSYTLDDIRVMTKGTLELLEERINHKKEDSKDEE